MARVALLRSATLVAALASFAGPARLAAQQSDVDIQRYRFHLTLPDSGKRLRVQAVTEFLRSAGNLSLDLDLLAPMTVRSAYLGCGTARAPTLWRCRLRTLRLNF